MSSTFKYFAYGSNLLEKRIHINNPTAKRICIALLKNYRLDFSYWSNRWGGNAATIVPDDSSFVWGAVWEIDNSNSDDLDRNTNFLSFFPRLWPFLIARVYGLLKFILLRLYCIPRQNYLIFLYICKKGHLKEFIRQLMSTSKTWKECYLSVVLINSVIYPSIPHHYQ
ncbi:unnamed protein product [Nezara viridula]|uniref:gamma-glutamylcyclotransferase n=1 Tax=Nezara viridula TaxID=85310 RepID=A0A9P0E9V1_NEZVI|nr:unnamed protein product [Nezara viridula]